MSVRWYLILHILVVFRSVQYLVFSSGDHQWAERNLWCWTEKNTARGDCWVTFFKGRLNCQCRPSKSNCGIDLVQCACVHTCSWDKDWDVISCIPRHGIKSGQFQSVSERRSAQSVSTATLNGFCLMVFVKHYIVTVIYIDRLLWA